MAAAGEPILVKLYGNRRLYRPESGAYVSLDDLLSYTRNGFAIVVHDASTGADITQFILDQSPTEH
jgi:polyhydroxyalkanoate synthesis regulator protein